MWANYLANIKKENEEATSGQRSNTLSETEEASSLISETPYLSVRNRFDSNGSETTDISHFSNQYKSLSDIWTQRNSSGSSTDELSNSSHEFPSSSISLVNKPGSSVNFENTSNQFSILGSRSMNIIQDANMTAEETLESAIKEYQNERISTPNTPMERNLPNYEIMQIRQPVNMVFPGLQNCAQYENARYGNIPRTGMIPFIRQSPRQNHIPARSTATIPNKGQCSFCIKNHECLDFASSHTLRSRDIHGEYVLTCPVLRKHICEICGATGNEAHTRTHCPVIVSRTGKREKPLAVLIKDTPRDAAGRYRKN